MAAPRSGVSGGADARKPTLLLPTMIGADQDPPRPGLKLTCRLSGAKTLMEDEGSVWNDWSACPPGPTAIRPKLSAVFVPGTPFTAPKEAMLPSPLTAAD